jgi:hypothetical protein
MAKVYDGLEMCQSSQNVHATPKESQPQNFQMTAVGYISDMEEIIETFLSNIQHDREASVELLE